MGIELELHSARPARFDRNMSRATLVRGSYHHGEALAQVLAKLKADGPDKLSWVDPYDNTLFNEQEAEVALREVDGLLQQCADESQVAAVHDLATLLKSCAATNGGYLWFIGD
ncbi:hypothetical protein [Streptomyces sp. NPDC056144]|uniref:hypothetical protein n=1 Tax=unclassified Streptomyces TaxID=2593676 RepID=UPI0035D8D157